MTRTISAMRMSGSVAGIVMLVVSTPLLSGCVSTGFAVAGLVAGLVDGQPESGSHGTRAQNGRGFDQSIGQALTQADENLSPACQALLPENETANDNTKSCGYRMVCLPGALQPVEIMICRKSKTMPN